MATIQTPKTQGLQSSTFIQPPLDGSLSLPALYDWQGSHSPQHPLFVFEETPGSQRTILWAEAIQGIHRATRLVRDAVGYVAGRHNKMNPPVIAVLASSDSITYASFIVGALRSGCVLFPLSPRNSAAAVTALLLQTGVSHLFISLDQSSHDLAEAAMKDITPGILVKHSMPLFEDLFPTRGINSGFVTEPLADIDMSKTAVIFHSSGTTAFPKPIYITHRSLVESSSLVCFGDTDLAGSIVACHSLPMFHGMGMLIVLFTVSSGMTVGAFKPQFPPVVPNPVNTFEGVVAVKSDYIFVPPTFIEMWSHDSHIIEALAKTKGIIYGSGPLTKEAGDTIVSRGVNIFVNYALTQTMIVNNFLQKPVGMDWEYFEISPARKAHFIDYGNNEFELVILTTESYRPSVVNTQINGQDAFATSDIISPHPTKPGFWKVVGRTDDQIMHSTGEKTNPGPLEGMLMRNPFVSGAVMFGRGRFHCGVLAQPTEPYAFDPIDAEKVSEFRSLIWPTIESINSYAPTHSRIFKEMILVTSPSKPFTYTAKGSIRRQAIINEYAAEIDALYAAVDESSQDNIAAPSDWSLSQTKEFVRQVVGNTMRKGGRVIADDADLFEIGLDSLQATWIRNSVLRALRHSHPSIARNMPQTFVYDYPSTMRLSAYLSASVTGTAVLPLNDVDSKQRELYALVDKYSRNFPLFKSNDQGKGGVGDVVLLTGGTGSLGSNILTKLIQNEGVKRIYAMSRPSSSGLSAKGRHLQAFEREALGVKMLNDPKIIILDGDAERADFGIDYTLYKEMQTSVTHIIHNAWRVNFNVAVTSFESNIRSVRNFVDFALGTTLMVPARILFISSIGVFQNYVGKELAPEEHLALPDSATGTGYAESKWVSEQILQRASEETPLSATAVRCGQMTGGPSGAWNEHEWFPSLIKSSVALGMLPVVDGAVSWITAYDAAGIIVDMLHAQDNVLHLVHPRPVPWSSLIAEFARALKLHTAPYNEWLGALQDAHAALEAISTDTTKVESVFRENPALRLIDFFQAAQQHIDNPYMEPLGIAKLENKKAMEASQTLREAEPLGAENVERWVSNWKKTGFIP